MQQRPRAMLICLLDTELLSQLYKIKENYIVQHYSIVSKLTCWGLTNTKEKRFLNSKAEIEEYPDKWRQRPTSPCRSKFPPTPREGGSAQPPSPCCQPLLCSQFLFTCGFFHSTQTQVHKHIGLATFTHSSSPAFAHTWHLINVSWVS